MPKIYQKYSQSVPKICPTNAKKCSKYAHNMPLTANLHWDDGLGISGHSQLQNNRHNNE